MNSQTPEEKADYYMERLNGDINGCLRVCECMIKLSSTPDYYQQVKEILKSEPNKLQIMKTHTIEVKDLVEWKNEQRVVFAFSSKEGKRLYANLNGGYEIEVKGVVVFQCIQPFQAVEKYNSITN